MGAIELRDVAVVRGGTTVIQHVDLRVGDGEVVALLGRSGSGKSTLLRVVAGHEEAAAGSVWIGGRDVTDRPANERGLGMVAQGAPLQPTRDVEGNLRMPFVLRGEDREEGRRRARGEALRFGLDKLLRRFPGQLSAGQQAATAMARSVVSGPSALLLDEPAASLDHQTRARVLQQVGIVQRTRGTTIIVATNALAVASTVASRIAVIDRGTVAQVAPLAVLRDHPATLDIADLVHTAPLHRVNGRVERGHEGHRTRIVTDAGTVLTWDTRVRDHDGPVVVGLPADGLDLVPIADAALTGTVQRIATTGPRRLVTVATDAGRVTVDVPALDDVPAMGARVGLEVGRAVVATPSGDVLTVLGR